jgi:plastocyanin
MRRLTMIIAGGALAAVVGAALAANHLVVQKNKKFSVSRLNVKVGDSVAFRNDDGFFHNIFSLSNVQAFDLGSYANGEARSVKFTKAGIIDVECAIHPEMKMVIEVKK